MGRTRRTYRDQLARLESEWQPYRRALRQEHQAAFDRLFEYASDHAAASGQQNPVSPTRTALFSMVLGLECERRALERRLERLEEAHGVQD